RSGGEWRFFRPCGPARGKEGDGPRGQADWAEVIDALVSGGYGLDEILDLPRDGVLALADALAARKRRESALRAIEQSNAARAAWFEPKDYDAYLATLKKELA
ncbi:hypothetical protein JWG42_19045, partial [Desulfoprunum benzoelyticum]|uniref:hypothetical protein n=1 Tax=Desulfoprunum benzoelyticum TaxID=1506996 RepID=UPI00196656E0